MSRRTHKTFSFRQCGLPAVLRLCVLMMQRDGVFSSSCLFPLCLLCAPLFSYIYQLAQTMKILPRMYAAGADDAASPHSANGEGHSSPQGAAMQAAAAALGDVDADVEFIRELEAEEAAAAAAAAGHNGEMQAHDQEEDDAERYDDEEEQEEDGFGGMLPAPVVEAEDNSKVRVAIM